MSEEKIIKHSQNAVQLLKSTTKSIKEKIVGVLEEIIIIIIAVSLTLAFHNWNDHRKEEEIARNFLIGIKKDLDFDAKSLRDAIKEYQPTVDYYDTVWQQINNRKVDNAYVDAGSLYLLNTLYFTYDGSRFEGFKSSGYLRLITNEILLKRLMQVYSTDMPFQKQMDDQTFGKRAEDFNRYIGTKVLIDTSGKFHVSALLNDPSVRYQVFFYGFVLQERQRHKKALVDELFALADEIDKELKK